MAESIPTTQMVAMVRELGGAVEFVTDYPVPTPGNSEVLAKVLYTGVCQSGTSIPFVWSYFVRLIMLSGNRLAY